LIVDTNALSAWRNADPALLGALASESQVLLTVITVGEYLYGARGARQRALNERWLAELTGRLPVLTVTLDTAASYAVVRANLRAKGRPIPANDIWIAALALQHRVPILSRDRHFDEVDGVRRVGW